MEGDEGVASALSEVRDMEGKGRDRSSAGLAQASASTPGRAEREIIRGVRAGIRSTPGKAERAFIHELTQASASTPGRAERAYAAWMGRA